MKTNLLFAGLLALTAAGCQTVPKENEAPVCSGRDRRPINIYPSALPVVAAPAADASAATPMPPLDDRVSPSGYSRSGGTPDGNGTGQTASLSYSSCVG